MSSVLLPRSLPELWELIDTHPSASVYAGGTDLLVQRRKNVPELICLERLDALKGVSQNEEGICIGSGTTLTDLLGDPGIREHLPVLTKSLETLGSPLIRNMGTIGGNICTASPAADLLPALYALGAEVELRSREGNRRLPINDFITGPGRLGLMDGEILSAVVLKKPLHNIQHFEKVGLRNALAIALASLAALLHIDSDGTVLDASLAVGSVGPTIVQCPEAEQVLIGSKLSRESLEEAAALVRNAVSPLSDIRAEAGYRKQVAGNLLLRLLDYA